jgi:hypothetical protein
MADLFADKLETSLTLLQKGVDARYGREAHQAQASVIDVPPERRFVGFDAYRKAIDSGVEVTWEKALNSQHRLGPETCTWESEPPVLPGPDGTYEHAVPVPGITKPYGPTA